MAKKESKQKDEFLTLRLKCTQDSEQCYTSLQAQQQLEERMAKLEAKVKKTPVWQFPMAIIATLLLICLVIFFGIFVFGEQIKQVWLLKYRLRQA